MSKFGTGMLNSYKNGLATQNMNFDNKEIFGKTEINNSWIRTLVNSPTLC